MAVIINRLISHTGRIPNMLIHRGSAAYRKKHRSRKGKLDVKHLAAVPPEVAEASGEDLRLAFEPGHMTRLTTALARISELKPKLRVYDSSWLGGAYNALRLQAAVRRAKEETGAFSLARRHRLGSRMHGHDA